MALRRDIGSVLALCAMAAFLAMSGGCNTSGCLDNRSAIPLAEFYSMASGNAISLSGIEIRGVGAPGDSVLLEASAASVSQVYLPMRSDRNSTSWCLSYHQEQIDPDPRYNDTLTFDYASEPYFASEECGAMFNYRITHFTHTSHFIDSVAIPDPLITNANTVGIKIFFRTDEQTEE